jgi:hypothetical protein
MSIPITTNATARKQATHDEAMRTHYAIEAHKAMLHDRMKHTASDLVKQAFAVAIIELNELQRTLKETR